MIRIVRGSQAPEVLRTRGRKAMEEACAEYDTGADLSEPDPNIYAHEQVKQALLAAQHGKCAFCESKFSHQQFGDVEHFRPKRGYRQKDSDPLGRPGYYWLAYEWTNLLLSCVLCNQQFKKNLFPLKVASRRALSHRDNLSAEEPLLIDPSSEEPARYLSFHEELVKPVRNSRRGATTIECLGLNREELAERRRDRLALLKGIKECRDFVRGEVGKDPTRTALVQRLRRLDEVLGEAVKDPAEYAAMARVLLQ